MHWAEQAQNGISRPFRPTRDDRDEWRPCEKFRKFWIVVTLTFASWNQIAAGLRQLDRLGRFVGGTLPANGFDARAKSSAGAAASLRRVSRTPHVVVGENRKNERL